MVLHRMLQRKCQRSHSFATTGGYRKLKQSFGGLSHFQTVPENFRSSSINRSIIPIYKPFCYVILQFFQKNIHVLSGIPLNRSVVHKLFCIQKIGIHQAGIQHANKYTQRKVWILFRIHGNGWCGNLRDFYFLFIRTVIAQPFLKSPQQRGRQSLSSQIRQPCMMPCYAVSQKPIAAI